MTDPRETAEGAQPGNAARHDVTASDPADLPPRDLPPAAQRALAEAEERRRKATALNLPPEQGGRKGPEPVRYGDWERKGIAVDF